MVAVEKAILRIEYNEMTIRICCQKCRVTGILNRARSLIFVCYENLLVFISNCVSAWRVLPEVECAHNCDTFLGFDYFLYVVFLYVCRILVRVKTQMGDGCAPEGGARSKAMSIMYTSSILNYGFKP